ncbi:MAG: hypothetical protein Q8N39_11755 [Pelolinea sp.]|nr:hypothetical protein [Pelolinea sp.]
MDEQEKIPVDNQEKPDNNAQSTNMEERRRSRGREPWVVGAVLILVGFAFLIQNLTGFYFNNWWALFILIPAFGSFSKAWQAMQNADGQLTSSARGAFIGGLVLTAVAAILFFSLEWVIFGPILLIIAGVAMLLSAILPK